MRALPHRPATAIWVAGLLIGALATAAPLGAQAPARIALVHTQTVGAVDPVVGEFVDRWLEATALSLGLQRQTAESINYPPDMAELWRVTQRANVDYALLAVVSARAGRYVVQLRLACRNGRGPFFADAHASEGELEATVARLMRQLLLTACEHEHEHELQRHHQPRTTIDAAPTRRERGSSWRFAIHSDAAVGLAQPAFYNHLLGGRVDLRFTPQLSLGGHLGYANLEGRTGRVHNLLAYALFDARIPVSEGHTWALPLRLGLGYLPRNGAFLRAGSGLSLPLSDELELVLDLPAAAFWVARKKVLLSLNLGLELAIRL